jgi:hypothetical protein
MSAAEIGGADDIARRLENLPPSSYVWRLVILLSLGGCFEIYDLFFTGYIAPGLARSGLLTTTTQAFFGFSGIGAFVAATFAGLFAGCVVRVNSSQARIRPSQLASLAKLSVDSMAACQASSVAEPLASRLCTSSVTAFAEASANLSAPGIRWRIAFRNGCSASTALPSGRLRAPCRI